MREAQEERQEEQERRWEEGERHRLATSREQQPPPAEPVELSTFVRIHLHEIHSDLRGVKWYYDKKVCAFWRLGSWKSKSRIHKLIHRMHT